MKLFDKNKKKTEALVRLLQYASIDPNQSIQEIVRITQNRWLQKKRKQNNHDKKPLDTQLRGLFAHVGMVDALFPAHKSYDYILLLGSDVPDMEQRISFLSELIKNGISASQVIVLCSDRPLYDYEKKYTKTITECQMVQELISKTNTKGWSHIKYCQVFGKTDADGWHQRATTEDTVKAWLATKPQPGTVLIISQQPYIGRQHAVMETYLKNGWEIETVGPQLATDFTLEDMLDTLARWLYQDYYNCLNRK